MKQIVTLNCDKSTLAAQFSRGQTFRVLGQFNGCLVRLSRVGDNAKLTCEPEAVGLSFASPLAPRVERVAAVVTENKYDAPHADDSGPSRRIVIATILAGADSGEVVMHLTPGEEREYNSGMARLAELG